MPLTDQSFDILQEFLHNECGLDLDRSKTYLLESRLKHLVIAEGLQSIDDLVVKIRQYGSESIRKKTIEAMTTNETYFFRDGKPFETLQNIIIPELLERKKFSRTIRFWSAACSTGQEAYTIAMCLLESIPNIQQWNISILASDIDDNVLIQTTVGKYSPLEVKRGLPIYLMEKYFKHENGFWIANPELKRMVKIQKFNLLHPMNTLGPFDCIFCRNVLIYFKLENKRKILKEFSTVLNPNGYFFLGSTESMMGLSDAFRMHRDTNGAAYYTKI